MDKQYLESSEFYNKRYNNFSTMIILPTVYILIFFILFSIFGKREITVEGFGNLDVKQSVPVIQGTTGNFLKQNHLKEGMFVKKGQTLLTYKNNHNDNQISLLNNQIDNINYQISSLETLKSGLQSNKDVFTKDDPFGYHDLLKSYLDQRNIYLIENQMLSEKSNNNINKQEQATSLINSSINRNQSNIDAYQLIYNAINTNKTYPENSKYSYIYQDYQNKIKTTSDPNEKASLKSEALSNIQQQIDDLQNTIESGKEQKISLQGFDDSNSSIDTNREKLSILQSDQIQSTNQQLSKSKQALIELNTNLRQFKDESDDYIIKAPKSGVVHLNDEFKGVKFTGIGSTLAQIYPNINDQNNIQIKAYISSQDISSVKRGQKIRFKIARNLPKAIVLQGNINNISVSPITLKQNNYYLVTANASISTKERSFLHYGMNGNISIITGKTTIFNYYKNKLLNKNLTN